MAAESNPVEPVKPVEETTAKPQPDATAELSTKQLDSVSGGKLSLGGGDDPHEHEADSHANTVMNP